MAKIVQQTFREFKIVVRVGCLIMTMSQTMIVQC